MDTVLTIIAVLGLGALLISAVIFTLAARRYVSNEESRHISLVPDTGRDHRPRSNDERRQAAPPAVFPITANGVLITEDRRRVRDRRHSAV